MDTNETTRWRKVALVGAGLALAVPLGAVATGALAGAAVPTDEEPAVIATDEPDVIATAEICELTEVDLAELNEESDALAAYLAERGIAHTVATDEDGYRNVEFDYEDEAANAVVGQFYSERYPLTAEEVAELNDEADAMAAFLAERGIAHTVETDDAGVRWVEYGEDEATWAAVDAFYAERYPLTAEEVAELNVEADQLVALFEERGIAYTVETDASGVRLVDWDYEDEAANAAADEVFQALYPEDELAC